MATIQDFDNQLKEVDRELALRRRLYPKWVAGGSLTSANADKQIKLMEDVRETVRQARQAAMMTGMGGKKIE